MTGKKVKRETKDDMKDKTKFLDSAIEKGGSLLIIYFFLRYLSPD